MKSCWLCGRNGNGDSLERHHIFGASNRSKSERDGLVVYLCGNRCHRNGPYAVHNCKATMQRLHEFGEREWLANHIGATINDFRREFGSNYLEE